MIFIKNLLYFEAHFLYTYNFKNIFAIKSLTRGSYIYVLTSGINASLYNLTNVTQINNALKNTRNQIQETRRKICQGIKIHCCNHSVDRNPRQIGHDRWPIRRFRPTSVHRAFHRSPWPSCVTNSAEYRTVSGRGPVANVFKTFSTSVIVRGGIMIRDRGEKRGDRFAVERRGNICGTRPTIIGTFPLTSRNGERGTHMARREGTIEEISPITQWLLCLFLFRLDFHTIFPPDYIYIYIRCICFSPSLATMKYFFQKFLNRRISIDKLIMERKK